MQQRQQQMVLPDPVVVQRSGLVVGQVDHRPDLPGPLADREDLDAKDPGSSRCRDELGAAGRWNGTPPEACRRPPKCRPAPFSGPLSALGIALVRACQEENFSASLADILPGKLPLTCQRRKRPASASAYLAPTSRARSVRKLFTPGAAVVCASRKPQTAQRRNTPTRSRFRNSMTPTVTVNRRKRETVTLTCHPPFGESRIHSVACYDFSAERKVWESYPICPIRHKPARLGSIPLTSRRGSAGA